MLFPGPKYQLFRESDVHDSFVCDNAVQGFGLMLTDDNSCYEGEFMDITQLCGKVTVSGITTLHDLLLPRKAYQGYYC